MANSNNYHVLKNYLNTGLLWSVLTSLSWCTWYQSNLLKNDQNHLKTIKTDQPNKL